MAVNFGVIRRPPRARTILVWYKLTEGFRMSSATRLVSVSTGEVDARIGKIYDHLYANAPVRTPMGIAYEVGKILHSAMFAEVHKGQRPAFEFLRQELKQLEQPDTPLATMVARQCRGNFAEMNAAWKLYPESEGILLSDFDLTYSCGMLSGVLITDHDRDVFGDALEIFRSQWAKRHGGQFFTDQRVTALAVSLLRFDPLNGEDLVDICAGTGGFLLAGLRHIQQVLATGSKAENESRIVQLAIRALKGQEIDLQVTGIANSTLCSRLGHTEHPIVRRGDSLAPGCFVENQDGDIRFDTHYCAATNPPFGTKITVKDPRILRNFDLALVNGTHSLIASRLTPRAPDILFIEQNLKLLKPGVGRLAIVIPYQIASGAQALFVREWLLKKSCILAVIDLPADTFQPHTGTKACLLVVRRRDRDIPSVDTSDDPPIFMAVPRWIGHDRRGNPMYRRSQDGTPTPNLLTDFPEVERAFSEFLAGREPGPVHNGSFVVSPSQISSDPHLRFNAAFHRPLAAGAATSSSKMRKVILGDMVKRVFYPTRFKRNYVDWEHGAVPFLGGTNISQFLINTDKWLRCNDPMLDELRVRPGWILVTRSGSTGIVAIVPKAWDGYAVSEHVIRVVPTPEKLAPEYLYVFLQTKLAREAMARGIYGSVIDEISPQFIEELEIALPEERVLNRIVSEIRNAETGRDEAIRTVLSCIRTLEDALS